MSVTSTPYGRSAVDAISEAVSLEHDFSGWLAAVLATVAVRRQAGYLVARLLSGTVGEDDEHLHNYRSGDTDQQGGGVERMNAGELDAAMARLLGNETIYRREAALGQVGVDAAITTAIADWRLSRRRYAALMANGQDAASDSELREAGATLICLGRLLALKDGLPAEHHVSAFNRGRDHLDRLDATSHEKPAG
ncbi:hypothetical protein [Nonomuraea guangzhouensis]|uniref:Uncharacterized protein n=1 Tax=Nonomuraea guangzhouensis TaxID=1291555 RepID=A0ABW4GZF7_9ACTN|nr:hypothetical protein [Nonomuraea guangzhouensis]